MKYITGEKGSTLIAIIIAMVIIAVLAAAVYTLNTTALFNQVAAQRATKAYYLSESGIRIAQSEYRAAVNDGFANSKLPALHNKTFNLPDNISSFTLYVYPHWLYAKDPFNAGTTNNIILYLPGALPRADETDTAITFPASGLIRVKDVRSTTTTVWSGDTSTPFTAATSGTFDATLGTPITLTLTTAFTDNIVAGDEFYIGYTVGAGQGSTQSGTSLTLYMPTTGIDSTNMAKYFPPQGGTIFIPRSGSAAAYKYNLRIVNTSVSPVTVTLTKIQDLDGNDATPNILSGSQVFIGKSVGFRSSSTYGGE
jgi:hypothetical protein